MNDSTVLGPEVRSVELLLYVSEPHYRFLMAEAKKIRWPVSEVVRRIVENAIRDAQEAR